MTLDKETAYPCALKGAVIQDRERLSI